MGARVERNPVFRLLVLGSCIIEKAEDWEKEKEKKRGCVGAGIGRVLEEARLR